MELKHVCTFRALCQTDCAHLRQLHHTVDKSGKKKIIPPNLTNYNDDKSIEQNNIYWTRMMGRVQW